MQNLNNNNTSNVGFSDLPSEVIIKICSHLNKEDIATMSFASKFFYECASNDALWENSYFYQKHIPHQHIGESKKIVSIKMMRKCIEAFAPIFFDSFTKDQLNKEITFNKLESGEPLTLILMKFYNITEEIQQMETDPSHKFFPIKYKSNVITFATVIEMCITIINIYKLLKSNKKANNYIEPILSKCLCNPNNIQDIEKIKFILDTGVNLNFSDAVNTAMALNAPYEVIEFLEIERIKSGIYGRTPEQLEFINQILTAAKEQFKGHETERSLLIFILLSVSGYRGHSITTNYDKENALAVDFLREQCNQLNIELFFLH